MGIEGQGREKAVLICGIDGYIGHALGAHLDGLGYAVKGCDNYSRRALVRDVGSDSLIPIIPEGDVGNVDTMPDSYLKDVSTVIHLAEQPSAPFSMRSEKDAWFTQVSNLTSTLNLLWLLKDRPDIHLIKLGSMGEYGTPDVPIPEGFIEESCPNEHLMHIPFDCPMEGMMFPRQPGSFYHLSKVFDSMNIEFACRMWGLRSTDIMQGVVFGHEHGTRFDYDDYFGTVINRFCVQAISDIPLTVYGKGGQTRGYLPLRDSLECITLAIENPPKCGEYRVLNQFARTFSVNEIAETVEAVSGARIEHIPNPRIEAESHIYEPAHDKLFEMGYNPTWDLEDELSRLIHDISPYKDRVIKDVIQPRTTWR